MKILIADDDEIERQVLRDILRAQLPCDITEAPDGSQALELLQNGLEPDACFFDVRMPGLDGMQLLSRIRDDSTLRHLKVVMTSSARDREVIVALGKLGIAGYLLKPFEYEKTRAALTQCIGTGQVTVSTHVTRNLLAKTVMIVDDDAMTRTALRDMITTDSNIEVVEAQDGLLALEQFRNGIRPDLAIFDLKMPRLGGQNLLARVREDPSLRNLPVLIISGQQDRDQIKALVQLRISGYLLKPFDAAKIRAAVQQALRVATPESNPPITKAES
jgi:CheY-like chemotaxis protein